MFTIKELMTQPLFRSESPDEHLDIISTLDPFFEEKCICCCTAREDMSKDDYARAYIELIAVNSTERHAAYRVIDCKHCVILIYTGHEDADAPVRTGASAFRRNFSQS